MYPSPELSWHGTHWNKRTRLTPAHPEAIRNPVSQSLSQGHPASLTLPMTMKRETLRSVLALTLNYNPYERGKIYPQLALPVVCSCSSRSEFPGTGWKQPPSHEGWPGVSMLLKVGRPCLLWVKLGLIATAG